MQVGFLPISRIHLKRLIMSQEVCHGNGKEIHGRVEAGGATVSSMFKCSCKPSPLLSNIMLHEFDAWMEKNYLSRKMRKDWWA
ncbi:MAG: hypothetical protein ABS69_17240 [Nitrosomonadales bacterium SCN 54-20]|nr:MAG: hypothetical protein ABS69_17240 [Nitrosomonadales bacterium SCN 54-20]